MIKLHTNFGDITLELDSEKAPLTVQNFKEYVTSGHYDNTIFHRVIDGFMIQGQNEAANGLKNDEYTVAMARTSDVHSASAQFFINVADNNFLNYSSPTSQGFGYCVFGKVVEGQDVVDKIKKVKTGNRSGHQNVPLENVTLEKAEVIEQQSSH
jgi:peptidyl-prolyl cis-trans isomerase B (cyclophilin B)